ncbi:DUF294 nucleotidyltransferase-like domain-containing protein [Vogesella indigofera]|uniref:DUF294 nucleotidyltransferase-like domain-containing protein n=1 Tax=Vogesella indigofera TaxID=45465 RepID=UPI00234EB1E9|nr:DUF294 nucleotidyltransferase-like domain-containing protein [Vogesella indigofera]MDC7707044.1 DUF294 nucleotidyltransferase-like domain-containing protein [Vogesella indigofera]
MSRTANATLVSATVEFLRKHSPFDRMEDAALAFLGQHAKLAYYPKDSLILTPDMGPPPHFYVVQRGKVLSREDGESASGNVIISSGECFPIGAASGQRATICTYSAVDDVFCYQLDNQDFQQLLLISPVFNRFCASHISTLLSQSRKQMQAQFSQRALEQQSMATKLHELCKRPPVTARADDPLEAVLTLMGETGVGSIVIVSDSGVAQGIFTQSDVLKRVVLPKLALDCPISQVMSRKPHTLPQDATAYDAALAMAMHGIRHVLAVDDDNLVLGVISERDLFAMQRVGLRQLRYAVETAADIATLQQVGRDLRQFTMNMLGQGVGAEQLTQFISALNDGITRRVIELNLQQHDLYGVDWAWLSFGSEGREEQTFSTDQDNGIIYLCPEAMDKDQLSMRLLDFARDVNADLDRCGFPLCKGNIMAGNPEWCLTLEEWQEKFARWIRAPDPVALLNASIFFDFRPLYGKRYLANQLHKRLLALSQDNSVFQRMLAGNALAVAPPLGLLRDFSTEEYHGQGGYIDLKKSAARLFVDAARVLALAKGIAASSTIKRLERAAKQTGSAPEETAAIIDAFNFIQMLRLRHQHLEDEHGRPGDNLIQPDKLNPLDRRILKESFRQARKLQQKLKVMYQL